MPLDVPTATDLVLRAVREPERTTNVMCHIAMLEDTDDGDGTTWLEPVSDDAYRAAHHG
jgi:hypothetical protein